MSDFSNNLTMGGFIATIVALLLALFAYFISRRAQITARNKQAAASTSDAATPSAPPGQLPLSDQPFDPDTNPYRWD